uniref:Hedgehog protein n=1 Tax=Strigamia maritima TaxID=126957 RepID=T1IHY2_STRMM
MRRRWKALALAILCTALVSTSPVDACGPGRGGSGRRAARRKLMPLVFKQHVPNVSENTLGASGLPEGKVHRGDKRFHELVVNRNLDIVFKNEEGTGTDWLMTQRCKEKLNTLAISVMNQWPGVKLRVTEAWDDEGIHATDSLHYEGRAVDITTSDRDRSKYGLLARLAVQAGFDWVYYESRSHIHCSVKSESSQAAKSGGCFPGNSTVQTSTGKKLMSDLKTGDEVLTLNSNKELIFSPVILFLDRNPQVTYNFIVLETESSKRLTLTRSHLVVVLNNNTQNSDNIFAGDVRVGNHVYVIHENNKPVLEKIISVSSSKETGIYAPLTQHGTVIVNDVLVTCYATFGHSVVSHWVMAPVRILYTVLRFVEQVTYISMSAPVGDVGVHWYPRFLFAVVK